MVEKGEDGKFEIKIGISPEERALGAKYARRYGFVDWRIKIRRGMKWKTRVLYLYGYDNDGIKYRIRMDMVRRMLPPHGKQVVPAYKAKRFILKAREIHGDKYDYSLVKYHHVQSSRTKIPIICPRKGHGIFHQTKDNHVIDIRGCPVCAKKKRQTKWRTILKKK